MEQLLGRVPLTDRPRQLSQRGAQKLPVRIRKIRGSGRAIGQTLRLRDATREVGRNDIDLPHASVQPLKCLRIVSGCDVTGGYRPVVGPQCDDEPVTHVDARLHPRIERSHGAIGFGEPTSDLDFELCTSLAVHVRDPS